MVAKCCFRVAAWIRRYKCASITMPVSTAKADRKAALDAPKANKASPLPAHPYDGVEVLAHEAVGLKRYTVVAPRTLNAAMSPNPTGPLSVEFAPAYAVPGKGERRVFDTATIAAETRAINRDAAQQDLLMQREENERKAARKNDEKRPRRDMGDFQDDESWEGEYLL